jgi:Na+/H+ antiporter NhaC
VLPALILGILTACAMMLPCLPPAESFGGPGLVAIFRLAVERYLVGALTDPSHSGVADPTRFQTVLATLTIAGVVGVIHLNGGTAAFVAQIARLATTRIRGMLATYAAGLAVFFDDYSNCLIIGPTMRPLLDRLRVSREKLSYIIDSTAAPVASLAPFGTWIATEVGFIGAGFSQLESSGPRPAFLEGVTAYQAFLASIPYRYYAIFTLLMVLILAATNRDFGPMRRAERRVRERPDESSVAGNVSATTAQWWYAGIPVGVLIVATMTILFLTGFFAPQRPRDAAGAGEFVAGLLSYANAYISILYGAMIALVTALAISVTTKAQTLAAAFESMMAGVQRVFPAVAILVLAWTLSDAMRELHIGKVAVHELQAHKFPPTLLPLLIFVSSCVVSFATGTSWGTMGIICPVAVLLAGHLGADMPPDKALALFYGSVGSVLAGAVFGDHCSPISDTTVLSALATECPLERHVWTQAPYALVAAGLEIVAGDLLCGYFGWSVWIGLLVGTALLLTIILAFGRTPERQGAALSTT